MTLRDVVWALCGAESIVLAVILWTLWRQRRRPSPPLGQWEGDTALLALLSRTGPCFLEELRAFGWADAGERIERLIWEGYITSEPAPGGLLYRLTPAGARRARPNASKGGC